MAKKFAFDKIGGDSSTIYRDHFFIASGTVIVNQPRHDFLAGPVFAGYKKGRFGFGDQLYFCQQIFHYLILGNKDWLILCFSFYFTFLAISVYTAVVTHKYSSLFLLSDICQPTLSIYLR